MQRIAQPRCAGQFRHQRRGGDEGTGEGGQWYLYVAEDASIYLPGQTYEDNEDVWQPKTATELGIRVDDDEDIGVLNRELDQYPDSFVNYSIDSDTVTTGGGAGSGMVYLAGKQSHKMSNDQMVDHIVEEVEKRAALIEAETEAEGAVDAAE